VNGKKDGWMDRDRWINIVFDGWMDGWMEGWIHTWMDDWINGCMDNHTDG
jgi:hypothetical protein